MSWGVNGISVAESWITNLGHPQNFFQPQIDKRLLRVLVSLLIDRDSRNHQQSLHRSNNQEIRAQTGA